MWNFIGMWVGSMILSYAFRPKTRNPSGDPSGEKITGDTTWNGLNHTTPTPATVRDFDAPIAVDGKEIPVLFGTREITHPNVVWYGDLKTVPIRENRTETGFTEEITPEQTIRVQGGKK